MEGTRTGQHEFAQPVVLTGVDSTRLRRRRARQLLTLHPAGLRLSKAKRWFRGEAITDMPWHEITGINRRLMLPRWSTKSAWAIERRRGIIFPHEFEEQWTTGLIGDWLRHYRPDLELPEPSSLAPQPLPVSRRMYPVVILPGIVAGVVVQVYNGISPVWALISTVGCLGGILWIVVSPRRARAFRFAVLAFLLVTLVFGTWPIF
jgi:hypothetical protein